MSDFYVYTYSCPVSKEPFYIGKGRGNRAWSHIKNAKKFEKNSHLYNKIRRMLEDDKPPIIRIVFKDLDEFDALIKEASLIAYYGRSRDGGCLCNLRKGWDGALSGLRPEKDKTVYNFKHFHGGTFTGTRRELMEFDPKVSAPQISSVINGKISNTAGWCLSDPKEILNFVGCVHDFLNVETGETLTNKTQTELSNHTGIDSGMVSSMVNMKVPHVNWWCLKNQRTDAVAIYDEESLKHKFIRYDGIIKFLNKKEASLEIGVHLFEIVALINGKRKHLRGWFYNEVIEDKLSKYKIDGDYPLKFLFKNCESLDEKITTRCGMSEFLEIHPKHIWNSMVRSGNPIRGWVFVEIVGFPQLYQKEEKVC